MIDKSADRWAMTDGGWRHRPRFKVAVNTVLRFIQRGQTKWLLRSVCEDGESRPRCTGYDFGPMTFEGPDDLR